MRVHVNRMSERASQAEAHGQSERGRELKFCQCLKFRFWGEKPKLNCVRSRAHAGENESESERERESGVYTNSDVHCVSFAPVACRWIQRQREMANCRCGKEITRPKCI